MTGLEGKTVALGVSGGIAAYKAVELLRLLRGEGAAVYVVMTPQAKQFVTPLTFEALSERPVYHGLFAAADAAAMPHVRTAGQADLLAVVPATANILGKMAHGLADDALSTFFTAYPGPVLAAPAMNSGMWANPAVQANVRLLKERGMTVLEPAQGELACGTFGPGRLPEPEVLLAVIRDLLAAGTDLAGRHFLVTAGPTREPLDPVRFISNPSSGKMGIALAR
ncbi:MAG: bifunctional phosphopantothenoylcysteine decarboxylase/phosphopantothenate--cysteine ligase CoaBC, partial [Nitrospinaceae bacterium]